MARLERLFTDVSNDDSDISDMIDPFDDPMSPATTSMMSQSSRGFTSPMERRGRKGRTHELTNSDEEVLADIGSPSSQRAAMSKNFGFFGNIKRVGSRSPPRRAESPKSVRSEQMPKKNLVWQDHHDHLMDLIDSASQADVPKKKERPKSARLSSRTKSTKGVAKASASNTISMPGPKKSVTKSTKPAWTSALDPSEKRKTPIKAQSTSSRSRVGGGVVMDLEDMKDEIVRLKKLNAEYEKEQTTLKTRLMRAEAEVVKKDRKIDELQIDKAAGCGKSDANLLRNLKTRVRELEKAVEEKESQLVRVKTDSKYTRVAELELEVKTYYTETRRLQLLLDKAAATTDMNAEEKGKITKLKLIVRKLQKQLMQAEQEREKLMVQVSMMENAAKNNIEMDRLVNENHNLNKKVDRLQETNERLREDMGRVCGEADRLREEVSGANASGSVVDKLLTDVRERDAIILEKENILREKNEKISALESRMSGVQADELDRVLDENSLLIRQLQESDEEILRLTDLVDTTDRHANDLEKQITHFEDQFRNTMSRWQPHRPRKGRLSETEAAKEIQAHFRVFKTKLDSLKQDHSVNLSELDAAAIRIQASWRGRKERQRFKLRKRASATRSPQLSKRAYQRENNAALKIQSRWRGHDARRRMRRRQRERAATKIQAHWRGVKGRKRARYLRRLDDLEYTNIRDRTPIASPAPSPVPSPVPAVTKKKSPVRPKKMFVEETPDDDFDFESSLETQSVGSSIDGLNSSGRVFRQDSPPPKRGGERDRSSDRHDDRERRRREERERARQRERERENERERQRQEKLSRERDRITRDRDRDRQTDRERRQEKELEQRERERKRREMAREREKDRDRERARHLESRRSRPSTPDSQTGRFSPFASAPSTRRSPSGRDLSPDSPSSFSRSKYASSGFRRHGSLSASFEESYESVGSRNSPSRESSSSTLRVPDREKERERERRRDRDRDRDRDSERSISRSRSPVSPRGSSRPTSAKYTRSQSSTAGESVKRSKEKAGNATVRTARRQWS